ncbi:FecCD family ABC transporter permease [Salsuginibacillus kocurii]|uniref:FecCD family ABC transporter permease n=1 Tax=Salsuginibacillus kocurii TaxID=427078 RepID=UPI00037CA3C5|nr:iron ABC transporter permease [Salsuginibacillus kocurii]
MKSRTYQTFRANRMKFSFIAERKALFIMALLNVMLVGLVIVSLGSGSIDIPFQEVVAALFGFGSDSHQLTIFTIRMPRVLLGILVGVGLALSGAILQGMIRNPLAAPDIIGVTSGATLFAVLYISVFSATLSIQFLPLFAFAGALLAVVLLYLLAWKDGVSPIRLILVGIGLTALLGAGRTFMVIFSPIWQSSQAYTWTTGSLHASQWMEVQIIAGWLVVLIPLLILMVRALNLQAVSEEITIGLGGRLQWQRAGLIALAACFAGIAVAFGGGIGFVGLMAPHMARKLVGSSFGQLLPVAALLGALIVVLADWIGRTWFAPTDIPVGVFTAMIGAPFFIYLFVRMKK